MTSLSGQSQRNDLSYTAPRGTSRLSRGGDSPLRPVTAGEGPAALPSPPRSPGSLFGSREPALGCRGQGPHPAFGSCITGLTSQPPPPSITQPPNLLSLQTALPHHLHRPALPTRHPYPPTSSQPIPTLHPNQRANIPKELCWASAPSETAASQTRAGPLPRRHLPNTEKDKCVHQ